MLLEGKRIFYIEDDLMNRAITQTILEYAGAKMGFERWGQEQTISKLKDFAPVDLILLDLMFPHNVSGYDVYDTIRQYTEFADIPIMAVSASDPEVEIPRTRGKGFAGFIGKPVDLRDFPVLVAACIAGEDIWKLCFK